MSHSKMIMPPNATAPSDAIAPSDVDPLDTTLQAGMKGDW